MSESLPKTLKSFFSKLLLIALAGSFVLWGIGDVFRSGGGSRYVAKVGEEVVTVVDYQRELNMRLNAFRRMLGENYSEQMVQALGIPQQVLSELIQRAALKQEVKSRGMRVPEEALYKEIMESPTFQGEDGFDPQFFSMALRNANMTEESYLDSLRSEISANLLMDALNPEALITDNVVNALQKARNQQRKAKTYQLSLSDIPLPEDPSQQELLEYFQQNMQAYRLPEYRRLDYIKFTSESLKQSITIPQEQLRSIYEQEKSAYQEPEKRKVQQLLYESKESAIHAWEILQTGKAFLEVQKEVPPMNQELDLGNITKDELMQEAQQAVFAVAEGGYTNPVETAFGWHVFYVPSITPETIPSFDELEPMIRERLQASQLEDSIYDLSITLEDKHAAGMTLAEIAQEHELKVEQTPFFDRLGALKDSKKDDKSALPPLGENIQQIFAEGFQPTLLLGEDQAYYFPVLAETLPATVPELESIKTQVIADWKKSEQRQRFKAKAEAFAKAMKEQGAASAQPQASKVQTSGWLKSPEQKDTDSRFDDQLRRAIFELRDVGAFSDLIRLTNGDYAIAELLEIKDASLSDDTVRESIKNQLSRDYAQEIQKQYMTHLQTKYPVEINSAILQQLVK
jgi:peptidyl-prolyl cis-trans isomerase D